MDVAKMFENINVAIVASDANYQIIYQNKKCRELVSEIFNRTDYVGNNIDECHRTETTEKVKGYYREYKEKKRQLDYYVMEEPGGKITVVNVPVYDGDEFAGVVEFIFESSLT